MQQIWEGIVAQLPILNQIFFKVLELGQIPQNQANTLQKTVEYEILSYVPEAGLLDRMQIFLTVNLLIVFFFILVRLLESLNPVKLYRKAIQLSFKIPFVANKMKEEIEKSKDSFLDAYPKAHRSQLKKIPYSSVQPRFGNQCEQESTKGLLSGSRYSDKKHSDFVVSLAKQFSYSNPLHFDLHPFVKQMEVEVIKMCAKMLNFMSDKNDVVGGFYSGGTESILMAILAYREYGFNFRGVTKPNLVICSTGHAAALKAASVFGIETRIVNCDSNYKMEISATKRNIDENTICVYTSYPNYPYGTVDPIDEIASVCLKKGGVPLHIDMCLGGYLVPFLKKADGSPILVVPEGVTSISLDCHKYGLSAKGASVLLFSSEKYRRSQLFVSSEWPGGLYGTIGISGSRSGAFIASAWISMMKNGQKGFTKNASNVKGAVQKLASELSKLGFKIFGKPDICCIGFNHPKYSVDTIKEAMKKKGWDIPVIQKPMAFHYSFTPLNCIKVDQMISDFKQIMTELKTSLQNKKAGKGSQLQVYGICSKIPDTAAKNLIMKSLLDMFLEI